MSSTDVPHRNRILVPAIAVSLTLITAVLIVMSRSLFVAYGIPRAEESVWYQCAHVACWLSFTLNKPRVQLNCVQPL